MATVGTAIEMRLARLFAPNEQERVRQILLEQVGENIPAWQMAGLDRLRCAVLKISDGRLDKLEQAVGLAKIDLRDVLMWADFGEPEAWLAWMPEQKS